MPRARRRKTQELAPYIARGAGPQDAARSRWPTGEIPSVARARAAAGAAGIGRRQDGQLRPRRRDAGAAGGPAEEGGGVETPTGGEQIGHPDGGLCPDAREDRGEGGTAAPALTGNAPGRRDPSLSAVGEAAAAVAAKALPSEDDVGDGLLFVAEGGVERAAGLRRSPSSARPARSSAGLRGRAGQAGRGALARRSSRLMPRRSPNFCRRSVAGLLARR